MITFTLIDMWSSVLCIFARVGNGSAVRVGSNGRGFFWRLVTTRTGYLVPPVIEYLQNAYFNGRLGVLAK